MACEVRDLMNAFMHLVMGGPLYFDLDGLPIKSGKSGFTDRESNSNVVRDVW